MSESSDTKFLNDCRRLHDIFSNDAKWNSSNALLNLADMETALVAGYPIAADVPAKLAPQKIKINARQATYAKIPDLVRRSRRYFKSSGATEAEYADLQTYARKLLGEKLKQPKSDTDAPAGEAAKSNSASHLSYDSQSGNLIGYRQFLGNVTAYQPNEAEIKLTVFDALITECAASNDAVSAGSVPLLQAWNLRDDKLYTDADSIYERFRLGKEYYKSLYQPNDPEYKAVTAIKLKKNRRS